MERDSRPPRSKPKDSFMDVSDGPISLTTDPPPRMPKPPRLPRAKFTMPPMPAKRPPSED